MSKVTTPPTVSVCIITYNHGKYIRQCLEGVMMQKTNFYFDVIIGEDCSTDETRSIIKEFEAKYPDVIKPIYHQKNVGAARNAYEFCYPRLTGKYVAICEGDDYWTDPYKLQKQVDFLEQNPDYSLCFHIINCVNEHDEIVTTFEPKKEITYYSWKEVYRISIPTLSAVFKNCIQKIPDEMWKARSGDTFLFGMLATYGGAADLGFVGAHYRKHPGGVYSSKTIIEQFKYSIDTRKLMKKSSFFSEEHKKEIQKELNRRKKLYIKYFIRKHELQNCLRIAFT